MKIVISNIVVLNGGDGALLFGGIKILKEAFGEDLELTVFSTEPERSKQLFPEVTFRLTPGLLVMGWPRWRSLPRRLAPLRMALLVFAAKAYRRGWPLFACLFGGRELVESMRIYSDADIVLSSGGTYLKESYGMDTQIADYRMTLALGRPLGFLTQTMGPFLRPRYRKALREIFSAAALILLRDEVSRQNVLDLGIPNARIHLCADSAFALAQLEVLKAAAHRSFNLKNPKIAISVRSWSHFRGKSNQAGMQDYMEAVAGAASLLIEKHSAEITFVSTCQGVEGYTDDSVVAAGIIERMPSRLRSGLRLVREYQRFDRLIESLAHYDLVIATRMHMAILALCAGTPALPIVAEYKTSELYKNLGLEDWFVAIESVSSDQLSELVVSMLDALSNIQPALMKKVEAFRASSQTAGSKLAESLGSS
jgi:colanic acid/amylovoran biosynthesis protein